MVRKKFLAVAAVVIILLSAIFFLIQKEITKTLENQLEQKIQILSMMPVEKFDRELERVQSVADYIGKSKYNFNDTVANIRDAGEIFTESGIQQGILTPDFKAISGQKFTPAQFEKLNLLKDKQSVIDYNSNIGMIFAAPVFIDTHMVYIYYTLYDKNILSEKFSFSHMADNHIVIETSAGEKIIFYPGYEEKILNEDILMKRLETQNSAAIFDDSADIFLFGTKLNDDFFMTGYNSRAGVVEEMFMLNSILPIIFILFALAIIILIFSVGKNFELITDKKSKAIFLANICEDMRGEISKNLTETLQDLSDIESGTFQIAEKKYFMKDLLENLISEIDRKNLQFKVEIDKELPTIFFGDAEKVFRMLFYILHNAIKRTSDGEIYFEVKALGFKRNMKGVRDIQFIIKFGGEITLANLLTADKFIKIMRGRLEIRKKIIIVTLPQKVLTDEVIGEMN